MLTKAARGGRLGGREPDLGSGPGRQWPPGLFFDILKLRREAQGPGHRVLVGHALADR